MTHIHIDDVQRQVEILGTHWNYLEHVDKQFLFDLCNAAIAHYLEAQPVAQEKFPKAWKFCAEEAVKQNQMLLEALKDAHSYIDYDCIRERIGNVIAAVEKQK